jgi:hypothetical protein
VILLITNYKKKNQKYFINFKVSTFTQMALQSRFGQGSSEMIVPLYSISSKVRPVVLSLFTPSAHQDFGLIWFHLPFGTALSRALCGRSSAPLIMCIA